MTTEWLPVFVLPNIPLETAIGCDIACLAPPHDGRVSGLKKAHPSFRKFLGRFSDNFGQKFQPTVLLIDAAAPSIYRETQTLASFRDLIAISAISYSWASEIKNPRGHRVLFGEAFAIYPWMIDKDYEYVIGQTPAVLGLHEVTSLRGQSSPALTRIILGDHDLDRPLLSELMSRWRRCYDSVTPDWPDVALMRSLNMAYNASLLPAGTEATFYDVGRIVSLWVSAFEILVHPGGNGIANATKVYELIERTEWAIPASGHLGFDVGGKTKMKRTLAAWLCQELYQRRNDFLHGNPVEPAHLTVQPSQRTILEYAAPLYRLALTAFLSLKYTAPAPPVGDGKKLGKWIVDRIDFMRPQKNTEAALITAIQPPSERQGRRRAMRSATTRQT